MSEPHGEGSSGRLRVAVALQGGGSHGAFTWSVLDRLLLEPDLDIVAISGTSAGAMNGAILADGLCRGGRSEARAALASYWEGVGRLLGYASFEPSAAPGVQHSWHLDNNPIFLWTDLLARIWSPYQTNPCNYHPLRALLERIDFEGVRARSARPARVHRDNECAKRHAASFRQQRAVGRCSARVRVPTTRVSGRGGRW